MFGKRPANAPEADHREHSLRSSVPLVVAAVLFGLGAFGMRSVLPYSVGHGADPLLITSPSQPSGADDAGARIQDLSGGSLTGEAIPDSAPIASASEPTEVAAAVFAVAASDQGVTQVTPLADPPTPTPTPPPATETPTSAPTETQGAAPTATPTPALNFIPDSREPGPIKPVEPVTAYFDPTFQQPAPVSPIGGRSGSQFPVTP